MQSVHSVSSYTHDESKLAIGKQIVWLMGLLTFTLRVAFCQRRACVVFVRENLPETLRGNPFKLARSKRENVPLLFLG